MMITEVATYYSTLNYRENPFNNYFYFVGHAIGTLHDVFWIKPGLAFASNGAIYYLVFF